MIERIHERVGGQIVGVAPAAMRVVGTVSEWERWTGMSFPQTGSYVVPGALSPVDRPRAQPRGVRRTRLLDAASSLVR